jgi:chromosome partitioning protein
MRIWAFVQQKGGAGKSTLATNLAVQAEADGEVVLIIDLDAQASAALWSSARGRDRPTVIDALPHRLADIITAAAGHGVTLALVDSPSKIDTVALAAIRAADLIICPTMVDLFNVGALRDTVELLEVADKLRVTVAVINNVDEAGAETKIGHAAGALEAFGMEVAPVQIFHRPAYPAAAEKGLGVIELGAKAKKAVAEIKALWAFLGRRARQLERASKKTGGKS